MAKRTAPQKAPTVKATAAKPAVEEAASEAPSAEVTGEVTPESTSETRVAPHEANSEKTKESLKIVNEKTEGDSMVKAQVLQVFNSNYCGKRYSGNPAKTPHVTIPRGLAGMLQKAGKIAVLV